MTSTCAARCFGFEKNIMTETVAIIGTGLIGRSWSLLFARAGYAVQVWDVNPGVLVRFNDDMATLCDNLVAERLLLDRDGTLARIRTCSTLEEAVSGVSFVPENGPEKLEVKRFSLNLTQSRPLKRSSLRRPLPLSHRALPKGLLTGAAALSAIR
jgi:2-polyprenyl-6-methoxyphenol hydroxylase-like FAD-dependent oxidoreductase